MLNTDTALTSDRHVPLAERHLSVTPLDVRQAKFGTSMRGFDRQEVLTFLAEAAEGYDQALRDNERLRQDMARLEGALSQFKDLEGSLKNTLISAQRLADELKENGAQEATRIVKEAEGRAEMILQQAHVRREEMQREIDGLKMKRREAETSIEATISALSHTLAFVREQDDRDRAEKIVAYRPRLEAPVEVRVDAPVLEAIRTAS
jgi:cell division initiation protein